VGDYLCGLVLLAMHAKDFAKQLDSDFTENIGFH